MIHSDPCYRRFRSATTPVVLQKSPPFIKGREGGLLPGPDPHMAIKLQSVNSTPRYKDCRDRRSGLSSPLFFLMMIFFLLIFSNTVDVYAFSNLNFKKEVVATGPIFYFDMGVDSAGKAHYVYDDGLIAKLYYTNNSVGTWLSPQFISNMSNSGTINVSVDIDNTNAVHAAFTTGPPNELTYAQNSTGTWSTEVVPYADRWYSIAMDTANNPHISYYEDYSGLNYSVKRNGSWNREIVDSNGSLTTFTGRDSDLILDSLDKAHIIYYDYLTSAIRYATNSTGAWTIEVVTTGVTSGGAIAIDSSNELHVAYGKAGNIYYSRKTGTGWVEELVAAGSYDVNNAATIDIAIDNIGIPYILYMDSNRKTLLVSENSGGSWKQHAVYITITNFGLWGSKLHLENGNLHVAVSDVNNQELIYLHGVIPPADLPRTSQTTCYDSAGAVIPCPGTGQDGEIQAGVPWPNPRFTDNGNATVTDNLTGLMWTKDGNAPGPVACSPATTKTWQDALDYVACLNTNSYLGYTDWRLPNSNELMSLVNRGQADTATWLNTQGFNNVQWGDYWSSTSYADYPDSAWSVFMQLGYMLNSASKTNFFYVWPVRSGQFGSFGSSIIQLPETGQTTCYDSAGAVISCAGTGQDGEIQAGVPWPSPRFTDNGDATVTDNLTGLMWTKDGNAPGSAACSPATRKNWQSAVDYVACLNANSYLGQTDWRLPNSNELMSLVNRGQANTAAWLNTQGFNNVQSDIYWSSTSGASYPSSVWVGDMWSGYMYYIYKTYNFYVWPVRSGQVGQAVPSDVRIDQAVSGDQRYPWADYNEATGEYLVLWQDKRSGANDDIYGVRLDQNGNRIGSDFPVSTAAGHQQRVLVKAGGGGYLALWHDLRNQATNGADIYGAWIAGDGTVGPEMAICACAQDQWNPVAGYDPVSNTFLVVWLDARGSVNNQGGNPNDDFDLYGVVIPAGGSQSLTPYAVVSANNGQRGPQIGYDYGNGQYYLAWNDRRSGADYDIYGARLTTSGVSLDGTGVLLSGATGNQFRPTVTDRRPADGIANHLIAWSDYRSGSQGDVYGVYVDGSGVVVSPGEFAISTDPADEANVVADVDWINTKKNMVSWIRQQDPATYYNIVTGVVDQAGGVTGGSLLNPVADEQRANALTYATDGINDYGFLEVSADRRNGTDYDIWGIKVWP